MCTLYKSAQTLQEDAGFYFIRFGAGSREEAMRTLSAAQHAIPTTVDLLVASTTTLALRPVSASAKQVESAPTPPAHTYDTPLPVAELSIRTYNALLKSRITTIGQFCALELHDFMWLRNFGKKAVAEAVAYRARLGAPVAQ